MCGRDPAVGKFLRLGFRWPMVRGMKTQTVELKQVAG